MKTTVKLEEAEEEALKTISEIRCTCFSCSMCPFDYQYDNNLRLCVRGLCQHVLEDYLNQD